jgi:endoglucanase
MANRKLNDLLRSVAKENDIPTQEESFVGRTGTDADKIHFTGKGITTALLSLPLRYMHAPAEVCSLTDVENAIELLSRTLCAIGPETDLDPFA